MFFNLLRKLNYIKKFPYFICTPLIYAIGTASEQILVAAAQAKRTNKRLLIFKTYFFRKLLKYEICNNALFDKLIFDNHRIDKKNFIYQLINFIIQLEFSIRRLLAIIFKSVLNLDLGEEFRFALLGSTDLFNEKKRNIAYLNLMPVSTAEAKVDICKKEKEKCKNLFSDYNPQKKKIVCLHVRDHNYYNDIHRRNYRNSDINNYKGLIEYLIEKNYLVVRLGEKSATKISFKHKDFIDYPFTNIKSEIMDLFLIKECSFFVGTPSGPMDIAYMFNKPLLLTNLYCIYPSFPRKSVDRGIFKKIICKKTGKILSLYDFAKLNIKFHQTEVYINEYDFIDNTNPELVDAIKEFVKNIEISQNFEKDFFLDDRQVMFNKFISKRLEEIYNNEVLKNNHFKNDQWKENEFIRIIKRFKSCKGTYCLSTLKNFNLN